MVSIGSVVVQVSDLDTATAFWAQALETYTLVHRDHNSSTFHPRDGQGVALQLNTDDRAHLDLDAGAESDQQAEVDRLLALGAQRVLWPYRDDVTVLTAPGGGLMFCVV